MKLCGRLLCALVLVAATSGADAADPLLQGFIDPPAAARPRVWWHWMNGNVTQDGIAKDFAWMKSIGIGGVQNFDANLATPQVVDQRLVYMSEGWKDAFRFAVREADRLGLEFAIAASPGWSETGGPWVSPQDGLKKLVWSEMRVSGGRPLGSPLPALPSVTGPFQDLPHVDAMASLMGGPADHEAVRHHADIAVLALPLRSGEHDVTPAVSSADGVKLDAAVLSDGLYGSTVSVARPASRKPVVISLEYEVPRQVSAATLFLKDGARMFRDPEFLPRLEAQIDGAWRQVAELPLAQVPTTVGFEALRAQRFRLVFAPNTRLERIGQGAGAPGAVTANAFDAAPTGPLEIGELRLDSEPRVDRFETKSGFSLALDYGRLGHAGGDVSGVPLSGVLDLTKRLKGDGTLDWTPPPGEWRILRLGYSLLGTTNHPAPPEATGLEVDKFDGAAVGRYIDTYLGMYRDTVGPAYFGKNGLRALLTDSIEVGAANWTPRMVAQFKRLRGYDPLPWLPTLTGTIIESRSRSDAFLDDFRRTLADLIASEHYGTVAAAAHKQGLFVYGEALEDGRPSLGDDMAMRQHADIPMAALWSWNRGEQPRSTLLGDLKGASSVAHVFGRPFAAAESMTAANSPWAFAPSDLRRIIDLEFIQGINRPVIHTSVHQPVDDRQPGLSLMIFGQYFNRHETWARMAKPWIDYLSRNAFLLQQGRNVADVAYLYGEEQPLTALFALASPVDLPVSHAFDFLNADILRNEVEVQGGEFVTKGGARYRALFLGESSRRMSLSTLRRIAALVEAGATVIGRPPSRRTVLGEDAAAFDPLLHRLWSGAAVTRVGLGRIVEADRAEEGLARTGLSPDFIYSAASKDADLRFVHRQTKDADLYFINNRLNRAEQVEARFRASGRRVEIWHADTGEVEALASRRTGDQTVVTLQLLPEDSFYVVFRGNTAEGESRVPRKSPVAVATLQGPWDVTLQPGRGAPAGLHLDRLLPLNEHADAGVRYFSGEAVYSQTFELPQGLRPGESLLLDLGAVGDVAEVRVNGKPSGQAWHAPYRVDIGPATQAGVNRLEVRVANLWVNRLIGDAQPGSRPVAFVTVPTYTPSAPLRPAGLIGPVQLMRPGPLSP